MIEFVVEISLKWAIWSAEKDKIIELKSKSAFFYFQIENKIFVSHNLTEVSV